MAKPIRELVTEKFDRVFEDETIYEAVKKIAASKEITIACVVNKENKLKGLLTPRGILQALEVREFGTVRGRFFAGPEVLHLLTSKYTKDIMSAPVSVNIDDAVDKVIDIMLDEGLYELPVVDKDMKVIGEVNYFSIIISSLENLKE